MIVNITVEAESENLDQPNRIIAEGTFKLSTPDEPESIKQQMVNAATNLAERAAAGANEGLRQS